MDLLGAFSAIKTFIKEESDTVFGLVFFLLAALVLIRYVFGPITDKAINLAFIGGPVAIVIIVLWIYKRHIPITKGKFTIAIAPLNILLLNAKTELTGEAKRSLKKELIDYIYSSLHFNKERLYLDDYIEIIRLPNRIKVKRKNAKKLTRKLNTDLIIWGEVLLLERDINGI